jgi:hypothetical protein
MGQSLEETYHPQTHNPSQNTTLVSSQPEFNHLKSLSHDFSMRRMMTRMKKYQGCWARQTAERQAASPKRNEKIGSVLKDAEQYRMKVEQKQLRAIAKEAENINPKVWGRVLRTSHTMAKLYEREVEKVMRTGLSTSGSSKWRK